MQSSTVLSPALCQLTDDQIIERVLDGESTLYELLVRRHNQQVYRAVRAVLRNDDEAEDVMQDAYVRAFEHLGQFEHRAAFKTWITRIAIHEALARLNKSHRLSSEAFDESQLSNTLGGQPVMDPEQNLALSESRALLEQAILALPQPYRTVIMLRDIQEMNTSETAAALDLSEQAVKVRLHRARALLRKELFARAGAVSSSAFQFHATRCDRVAAAVLTRIRALEVRA